MTSIQEHCCGADKMFDEKTAAKDYRKFLQKGPARVSQTIIKQLSAFDVQGKSLLDIGGGIGALQWWFLSNGGSRTVDVDASTAYLNIAQKHAKEEGWTQQAQFLFGNVVDLQPSVECADFITLDKVICCYPDYKNILNSCFEKSNETVALSYPMDGPISDFIRALGDLFLRLKKNPFRPYIHKVSDVRNTFASAGYERVAHDIAFPWHVETYRKSIA